MAISWKINFEAEALKAGKALMTEYKSIRSIMATLHVTLIFSPRRSTSLIEKIGSYSKKAIKSLSNDMERLDNFLDKFYTYLTSLRAIQFTKIMKMAAKNSLGYLNEICEIKFRLLQMMS